MLIFWKVNILKYKKVDFLKMIINDNYDISPEEGK